MPRTRHCISTKDVMASREGRAGWGSWGEGGHSDAECMKVEWLRTETEALWKEKWDVPREEC